MDIAIQLINDTIIEHTDIATYYINTKSNCLEITKIIDNTKHLWAFNLNEIRSYYIGRNLKHC